MTLISETCLRLRYRYFFLWGLMETKQLFTFYLDDKVFRKMAILFGKLAYHHLTDYAPNKEKVT